MNWRWATIVEAAPYQGQCDVDSWINPATAIVDGRVVRRIIATANNPLGYASDGDIGGLLEKESNLSQFHEAWVGPCGIVMDDAIVSEQAFVRGHARIRDRVRVFGWAQVAGNVDAGGTQWIYQSRTSNLSLLTDNRWLC